VLRFGCGLLEYGIVHPTKLLPAPPLVVGTVHSPGALASALKLRPGDVDLLELRIDAFASNVDALLRAVPRMAARFPLLATVRHPAEGAVAELNVRERRRLFRQFLPLVQWADFETRSAEALEEEIALAVGLGVAVVLSEHHFARTPSIEVLRRRFEAARVFRPSAFKVAAQTNTPEDLERLLAFFNWANLREPGRVSVMGMGPQGQVSRLLFGGCGSLLNYGYLDRPQVPGQWAAKKLKVRLEEIGNGLG
jgi:3-dehydroquinate dehydratase-1